MKIFKCLSQNVSVLQDTEEKPERRKYFLGFRQKKRRSGGTSKTNGLTSKGVGFSSPLKENELPLASVIVKRKLTPENDTVKLLSSEDKKELVSCAGASSASQKKTSVSTYRSRPSVQSTPFVGKCKSKELEDNEDVSIDVTTDSNISPTTAFFRKLNVSMSDYLPSFEIYQSPTVGTEESLVVDSPDVHHLNTALIASSSASDSCMDGYSNAGVSAQFSSFNSAAEWSKITSGTYLIANSTTTSNKGCSTDSSLDCSSSFISSRSVPTTFLPDGAKQKRLEFTTRSDTYLSSATHRRDYFQKHTAVNTGTSFDKNVMEIACNSSRIRGIGNATVNATRIYNDSQSQAGKGYDSVSHSGIDYDDSVSQTGKYYDSVCHSDIDDYSVSQAGKLRLGYDSVSHSGIDDYSVSQAGKLRLGYDSVSHSDIDDYSVSQAGKLRLGYDSVSHSGIDYDNSASQSGKGYHSVSQAGKCYDSLCHSGIDYDDSVSQAGKSRLGCDPHSQTKGYASVSHSGIDYDDSVSQGSKSRLGYNSLSQAKSHHSVSQAGKCYDSLCHSGIDYDDSVSPAGKARPCYDSLSKAKGSSSRKGYDSISHSGIDYDDSVSQASKLYHSVCQARKVHNSFTQAKGCDSVSSTGIDYDHSSLADSRFFREDQESHQMETDASQFSVNITSECPTSPLELKFMYIEQLMSLEQDFVSYMHFGIRKYWKPLQYRILTRYEHMTLFTNIDMLVKISEANLKSMRDNAAPDDSQTSEDQHMMLYLPATVYELEIQKQCQAYLFYGKELKKSNRILTELNHKRSFRDFVKSQHATREHYKHHASEECPSIQEFINRPAQHIQQLYAALQNILSVTPRDSHDAPILVKVTEAIFKCIKDMKFKN